VDGEAPGRGDVCSRARIIVSAVATTTSRWSVDDRYTDGCS